MLAVMGRGDDIINAGDSFTFVRNEEVNLKTVNNSKK